MTVPQSILDAVQQDILNRKFDIQRAETVQTELTSALQRNADNLQVLRARQAEQQAWLDANNPLKPV